MPTAVEGPPKPSPGPRPPRGVEQIKITHAVLLLFQEDGGGAANAATGKQKSKP